MAIFGCFSVLTEKKVKDKGNEKSSKEDFNTPLAKLAPPRISSETRDLEPSTSDVAVKISRGNSRVMSLESPMKDEVVEEAYEGEDENEDSPLIKRELSDFDLQGHEAVCKEGCDSTEKERKYPILNGNQANNDLEDKNDSVDMIQGGHVSDPGIGKADFLASPKLKRSCSNLEKRDVLRHITQHLPPSKSHSFEDFQKLSANPMVNLERSKSVMSHCSADRVMLKGNSSSQVLPSGSKKLWWKLFMWSHRNIHRMFSRKSTLVPVSTALHSQCGYSSDTLEPKQGKALRHVESSESIATESYYKSNTGKNIDNQRQSRFHNENYAFWPQNQWFAFSTESSSFARVDAWVKDLEIQQPLPEDDFDDENARRIVFPPSPDGVRSITRNTAQLLAHPNANLLKEILNANSVVQSLNPASSVAHISGVGIKAIPLISHLSNLRSVNLSGNFIVHISPGFLPKGIQTLNLSRNKISTLDGLRESTRLRVLDLSYNRISRIGQGLSSCSHIKELYLAGNKISNVEGLHRLFKLTVLDLSFNKITTTKALGQLVANYNSLQALDLLGNPIQSNMSDDQISKAVCGLLPKLVYLNKQPLKAHRAREILNDSVAKAALRNSKHISGRRSLKRVGQGGSSSTRGHRSSATVAQKSRNRSRR